MPKKLTTEEFINKAKEIHGDKYDYSKVEYVNSKSKVTIICPEHGEFEQRASNHLGGHGCISCSNNYIMTTEEYIQKAKEIHGDKYDYSKVDYINANTKVIIICPEHGEFEQQAIGHLKGCGCKKCGFNGRKHNIVYVINKFREIHGDKYDYSKVEYVNVDTKVTIICPEHGEFKQTPYNHKKGQGCPKCIGLGKTNESVVELFREIHGDKYDYSKVDYVNANTKVTIICPEHGEFEQTINTHLKHGCYQCGVDKRSDVRRFSKQEFTIKAKEVHGDRYDYSKVEYVNVDTKVTIICPEHGEFEQTPYHHIKRKQCCSNCADSISFGEKEVKLWLENHNIEHITQHSFKDCKYINRLSFDFYLPEYDTCIEFDGIQHYELVKFFGGEEAFKERQKRDKVKNEYCDKNSINLIRVRYDENINDKLMFELTKYGVIKS